MVPMQYLAARIIGVKDQPALTGLTRLCGMFAHMCAAISRPTRACMARAYRLMGMDVASVVGGCVPSAVARGAAPSAAADGLGRPHPTGGVGELPAPGELHPRPTRRPLATGST